MRPQILIMDVDGTMTDGKVYFNSEGECFKSFCIKDGYAIKNMLPLINVVPIVITGRVSIIAEKRMKELNTTEVYQGISNKVDVLLCVAKKYNCPLVDIAYIGDDINDLEAIKMCGVKGCPSDAVSEVKEISDYVCIKGGGQGCIREFVEYLIRVYFDGNINSIH